MRDHSNETVAILAGIGIGAALMFFLDPHRHNGRRPQNIEQPLPPLRAVREVEPEHSESSNGVHPAELADVQMR
jgi:hypothetical protein